MTARTAWLAGLVAVAASVGMAALVAWAQDGWGAGDLGAMTVWSLPLGVLLALLVRAAGRHLGAERAAWRHAALVPIGVGAGVLWTMIAATVLGGMIHAFSFPVALCWPTGGMLGGIAAAVAGRRRAWPAACGMAALALATLGAFVVAVSLPQPTMRVVLQPNATPAERDAVWETVLGNRTGRPGRPREHTSLPELQSIGVAGYEGDSEVLHVTFRAGVRRDERDRVVARVRRSPLVARVELVPPT